MHPVLAQLGPLTVRSHDAFVGLGVLVGIVLVAYEARRRGRLDDGFLVSMAFGLVGGAVGMRAAGWLRHLDPARNPSLLDAWQYGARSVLGGLTGAYVGVLVGKRVMGYRARTGDVYAPAVAAGMAIGRIGCLLAEAPGRPTGLPWGVHAPASLPGCAGCAAGQAMHPSFAYEVAFHAVAFVVLWRWRDRAGLPAGALLTLYLAAYAVFRFGVEFVRANEVVAAGLTRSQWFLVVVGPPLVLRALWLLRRRAVAPVPEQLETSAR